MRLLPAYVVGVAAGGESRRRITPAVTPRTRNYETGDLLDENV